METTGFPLTVDDLTWVEELARLTRRMVALPNVTPQQLVGLGRALYALQHLPKVSPGVDVEYSVSLGGGDEEHSEKRYWTIQISEYCFTVLQVLAVWTKGVGSDDESTICFQTDTGGVQRHERDMSQWVSEAEEALAIGPELSVHDGSDPDCLKEAPEETETQKKDKNSVKATANRDPVPGCARCQATPATLNDLPFDHVANIVDYSHESLNLCRCKECGQLFAKYDLEILLSDDDDDCWTYWVPVTDAEAQSLQTEEGRGEIVNLIKSRKRLVCGPQGKLYWNESDFDAGLDLTPPG